jgi:hypothetical protein
MNKNYVPYNIASAMKELGFDGDCSRSYSINDIDEEGNIIFSPELQDFVDPYYTKAPALQDALDWFEDEHSIYVDRTVHTSVNEVLDFEYRLRSWKFPPFEIEFEDVYDCFDRHKSRVTCLNKMIEIIKTTTQ